MLLLHPEMRWGGSPETKIAVHGEDGRDRMLVEVVIKTLSPDRICSNGLRAVRAGYSFAATMINRHASELQSGGNQCIALKSIAERVTWVRRRRYG